MITRRTLFTGGLTLGAAAALNACGNGQGTPGVTGSAGSAPASGSTGAHQALTVGLTYIPNVQFSAFYLGADKGIFADHGLDVTLRHHGEQEDVFGALLSGQEQVVFASADEAMVAAAGGNELLTFATSYQRYPINVLGPDATVSLPAEPLAVLSGHTLGIPGHFGSSYYAALCAIHQAGLTENEVTLVDIGYTALTALETSKVDFIIGFSNNELVQLHMRGVDALALEVTDPAEPSLVGPSLVTKGDTVAASTLTAVATAMADAEQAVIDDPEAALEATASRVPALSDPAQREAAAKVLEATTQLWLRDGRVEVGIDEAAFARMGEFLTTAGVIEQAPDRAYLSLS